MKICFNFSGQLTQLSGPYSANFTTISILGLPNFILDLKKEYDKTLKNIPAVSDDCLMINWKRIKIALIV